MLKAHSAVMHNGVAKTLARSSFWIIRGRQLQSRTKLMIHFVFWRKFRVEIPPTPIAMLKADENFIDKLTSMSSFSNQHCNGGGRGH